MNIETLSEHTYLAIGLVLALFVLFGVLLFWYRRNKSHSLIQQCMAIWAAQGPFESGDESAAAMRAAHQAVFGLENAKRNEDAIAQHADAYDKDPDTWENLRKQSAQLLQDDNDEQLIIAKGYAAMEHLNKEYLEEGGHKLEPTIDSEGNPQIAYRQTLSDEEIDRRDKERAHAMVTSIGEGLLKHDEEEASQLVDFLCELNRASGREDPRSPSSIGNAYFICLELQQDDPESEIAKEFTQLSDALSLVSPASPGEWSDKPGAHEQHLVRRRNNPYFPESRQTIANEELEDAKKKDIDDYRKAKKWLDNLLSKVDMLPETPNYEELNELRQDVEELVDFTFSMGDYASNIQETANELRTAIVSDMRQVLGADNHAQNIIDKAEALHKEQAKTFSIPLLAQIARKDSPIPEDDTIPAIISEPPNVIRAAMNIMSEDKRALIEHHGLQIMKRALDNGHIDSDLESKIEALHTEEEGS